MASVGKGSKNKGANAEREVAALLQPIVDVTYEEFNLEPPVIKRNLEQTRGGGYDLVGIDWLALEVKRVEQLQINKWWQQTLRQAGEGQIPVLIYKQNRKPWKVIMHLRMKIDKGKYLPVRAEITLDDFLIYFRRKLKHHLCGH